MATVRKRASAMSRAEQDRYKNVITRLIDSGAYGQLVLIHVDLSHDQHGSMGPTGTQRFLPWHRDFLLKLEAQMQAIDAAAFIPYWRWTTDRAVPAWLATFQPAVPIPGRRTPIQVRRSLGRRGRLPAAWEVETLTSNTSINYTTFTSVLEGFHNEVHNWVGGTMGNPMTSPADPLFWLHHAQIDRLWSIWQAQPGNAAKRPNLAGPDATLDPWGETAADVNASASLGYSYQP